MIDNAQAMTEHTPLIGLLRHGETRWNAEKRVQGHGNSELTARGRRETLAWARQLAPYRWQHILASDLGRVLETVAILNSVLQLPVTIEPRLREQHWGEWEGILVSEVFTKYQHILDRETPKGWRFRPPGGESREEVRNRAMAALTAACATHPGERILVVCHLGVIKCLVYGLAGREFLPGEEPRIEKNRFHTVIPTTTGFSLAEINIPASQPSP